MVSRRAVVGIRRRQQLCQLAGSLAGQEGLFSEHGRQVVAAAVAFPTAAAADRLLFLLKAALPVEDSLAVQFPVALGFGQNAEFQAADGSRQTHLVVVVVAAAALRV